MADAPEVFLAIDEPWHLDAGDVVATLATDTATGLSAPRPTGASPFGTTPLSAGDWLICVGLASGVLWAAEATKLVGRVRRRR